MEKHFVRYGYSSGRVRDQAWFILYRLFNIIMLQVGMTFAYKGVYHAFSSVIRGTFGGEQCWFLRAIWLPWSRPAELIF